MSVDIAFYYYLDLGILQLTLEAAGRNLRVRKVGYTGVGSPGNNNKARGQGQESRWSRGVDSTAGDWSNILLWLRTN